MKKNARWIVPLALLIGGLWAWAETTTPNMNLVLPTVGVTNGTTAANEINAAFAKVDRHNHTSGQGVPVPVAGLNINAPLSFYNNALGTNFAATNLLATQYAAQSGTLAATNLNSFYSVNGDAWWLNGSGTNVQLTAGGSLSASSFGGWNGIPSGTANADFGNVTASTFSLLKATNTYGPLGVGPVAIHDTAANVTTSVSLQSPVGLAGSYSWIFPAALPGATKILTIASNGQIGDTYDVDGSTLAISGSSLQVKAGGITTTQINGSAGITGGQIASATITGSNIAATTVARTNLVAVGQLVTSANTGQTIAANTQTPLTNLSGTLTTNGRPVMVFLEPTTTSESFINCSGASGGICAGGPEFISLYRDNVQIFEMAYSQNVMTSATSSGTQPGLLYLDTPNASTHTYRVDGRVGSTGSLYVQNYKLVAYEL